MEYLEQRRSLIEGRLEPVLGATEPDAMAERLEHVSLSGGKRVRPMVTLLAFEAAGGELAGEDGRGTPASADAVDFAVQLAAGGLEGEQRHHRPHPLAPRDRKSTRLNSSHRSLSRMPSSA